MNLNKFNIFYEMNWPESYSGVENNKTEKTIADYLQSIPNQKTVDDLNETNKQLDRRIKKAWKPLDKDIEKGLSECDINETKEKKACIQDIQSQLNKLKPQIIGNKETTESNESKDSLWPLWRAKIIKRLLWQKSGLDSNVFPEEWETFKFTED